MPNVFNGNYYMAGDKSCKRITSINDTRVMCYDKKGQPTGYRDAMTAQDMQAWQYASGAHAADMQNLNNSIQQLGQSAQNWSQQFQQQGQSFSAPQVQPITPYGTSNTVTYRQVGDALIGSNGVTYRSVGNNVFGSDGTKCQIIGPNIICR
jgi:hypothetical protein